MQVISISARLNISPQNYNELGMDARSPAMGCNRHLTYQGNGRAARVHYWTWWLDYGMVISSGWSYATSYSIRNRHISKVAQPDHYMKITTQTTWALVTPLSCPRSRCRNWRMDPKDPFRPHHNPQHSSNYHLQMNSALLTPRVHHLPLQALR